MLLSTVAANGNSCRQQHSNNNTHMRLDRANLLLNHAPCRNVNKCKFRVGKERGEIEREKERERRRMMCAS